MGQVVRVEVAWKSDWKGFKEEMLICVGDLPKTFTDDNIFIYCQDEAELDFLTQEDNGEDFYVTNIYGTEN